MSTFGSPTTDYYWNPGVAGAEFEAEDVSSVIPGLGMLANSHLGLINAMMSAPRIVADLRRGRDPGAGASTHFHNVHFTARYGPIEAGSEVSGAGVVYTVAMALDSFGPK